MFSLERMMASKMGTLRVFGPDRSGIVAAMTQCLGQYGCNIVKSQQWTDRQSAQFFQRLAFMYDPDRNTGTERLSCQKELEEIANHFQLDTRLNWRDRKTKIGIMVSKFDHCLWELLLRNSAHELDADIGVIISNHDDLRHVADTFGIPFHFIPVSPHNKLKQEEKQLALLEGVDLVVLARYGLSYIKNGWIHEKREREREQSLYRFFCFLTCPHLANPSPLPPCGSTFVDICRFFREIFYHSFLIGLLISTIPSFLPLLVGIPIDRHMNVV